MPANNNNHPKKEPNIELMHQHKGGRARTRYGAVRTCGCMNMFCEEFLIFPHTDTGHREPTNPTRFIGTTRTTRIFHFNYFFCCRWSGHFSPFFRFICVHLKMFSFFFCIFCCCCLNHIIMSRCMSWVCLAHLDSMFVVANSQPSSSPSSSTYIFWRHPSVAQCMHPFSPLTCSWSYFWCCSFWRI